ncbi:MAG: preprotein translocase subunit SecE [Zoogloeaceae bacterium]|jgi:preprotein translocase subunit SecE|nr:preprotein translocase subunit SecE [Zoogloeaceae bacterium]
MIEKIKIAFALLLVVAGVVAFYLLSGQAAVFRVLAVGAGLAAGLIFFCRATALGRVFWIFCGESWVELKKVVWPTRKETVQLTGVVFLFAVVMAAFLFLTDKTLEWVMYDLILGWKKS